MGSLALRGLNGGRLRGLRAGFRAKAAPRPILRGATLVAPHAYGPQGDFADRGHKHYPTASLVARPSPSPARHTSTIIGRWSDARRAALSVQLRSSAARGRA